MKETEAQVDFNSHQLLLYVEKSDGQYGPLQTGSYLTKNYVEDFWEKQQKLAQTTLKKLIDGKISPVGYYMQMVNISTADLANRVGVSKGSVRKHQEITHFTKLRVSLIKKYADVFGVPLANMFQVLLPSVPYTFMQKKTSNSVITTTEIVEEKK
jgi:hypothetical protein